VVEKLGNTLGSFSKVLMVIGGAMLAYTLMSYVSAGHGGRHVLKSGNAP
jgi:hypothetical protein